MNTTEIIVVVLVVCIIILLFHCWTRGLRGSCSKKAVPAAASTDTKTVEGMEGEGPVDPGQLNDGSRYSHQISPFGSGPLNRELYAQYKDLKNLKSYNDYNQVIQYEALEPEVFASQEAYATDINRSTSGASSMTIRTDNNDVVPWVGLKRPDYYDVGPGKGARTDTSEYADQMPRFTRYLV
jgi:hypothetical protein